MPPPSSRTLSTDELLKAFPMPKGTFATLVKRGFVQPHTEDGRRYIWDAGATLHFALFRELSHRKIASSGNKLASQVAAQITGDVGSQMQRAGQIDYALAVVALPDTGDPAIFTLFDPAGLGEAVAKALQIAKGRAVMVADVGNVVAEFADVWGAHWNAEAAEARRQAHRAEDANAADIARSVIRNAIRNISTDPAKRIQIQLRIALDGLQAVAKNIAQDEGELLAETEQQLEQHLGSDHDPVELFVEQQRRYWQSVPDDKRQEIVSTLIEHGPDGLALDLADQLLAREEWARFRGNQAFAQRLIEAHRAGFGRAPQLSGCRLRQAAQCDPAGRTAPRRCRSAKSDGDTHGGLPATDGGW